MEARYAAHLAAEHRRLFARLDADIRDLAKAARDEQFLRDLGPMMRLSNIPAWRALRASLDRVAGEYADVVRGAVADAQDHAAAIAAEHGEALVSTAVDGARPNAESLAGSFRQVPVDALRTAIAALHPLSPLRALEGMGETMSHFMGRALLDGIAHGHHPTVIARRMRKATGMPLSRALTISRTETLRAYRSSTLDAYRANSVVTGWVWYCAGGTRTCAACYAMSGTIHTLDDEMGAHPNCRCTQLPYVAAARDQLPASGVDRFTALDEADQLAILGPSKFTALRSGQITLPSLVKTTTTREWGATRTVASLNAARKAA